MAQQVETEIYYPESDGQPMGETELHRKLLNDLVYALTHWLAGRADAHVSGNVFIYYVKGDPRQVICPDVFVAFGSHKRLVNTYQTWHDGPFPQVVIELLSRSTRAEDEGPKRELYERLGVLEYYLFDPHFDPLDPMGDEELTEPEHVGELMRYRRPAPDVPFGPVELVAPGAVLHSELLGLGFIVEGRELRVVNESVARVLPNPDEEAVAHQAEAAARQAAEEQAHQERAARKAAEEHAQALADQLARLRAPRDERGEPRSDN